MNPADHVLKTFASVPFGSRILDMGCGEGQHSLSLALLGFDLYGCDMDERLVEATRKYVASIYTPTAQQNRFVAARHNAFPYPTQHFDWILAYRLKIDRGTASHINAMVTEAQRVLTLGGWIYVAVPTDEDSDGIREVSAEFLLDRMQAAGFVQASEPEEYADEKGPVLAQIFRKVDAHTPL